MERIVLTLASLLLITSCSAPVEESKPENSNLNSIIQPTPTCSTTEFQEGSAWIKGQLEAFSDSTPEKAYSYASEDFRRANSLESFAAVILSQYTMLLNIKDYQILSCEKNGELFLFNLMLSDKESNTYAVEYVLSLTEGKWGVDGASVSLKVS
jgi:hypothetical protein